MDLENDFIREWWNDDDDKAFTLKVRLRSVWDEDHFVRMERVASEFLDALEKDPSRRERWRYTFTDRISMIQDLLRHPGFLAENDLAMSTEQYKSYIEQRIERFEALKKRYQSLK